MLYIYTVLMKVFRLYDKGVQLERERVLSGAFVTGELAIRDRPDMPRQGVLIAQLMKQDDSYVIPVLTGAQVVRITRRGLLISGREVIPPRGAKGYDARYEQAWWCEPI